jgi:large subunit ribosomal protein L28
MVGNQIVRRGKAKKAGGVGQHVTGITKRRWLPNVHKTRVIINGVARRVNVCTSCLKAGKVQKAV